MRYTPHTTSEVESMLATVGASSLEALVAHIPAALRERATLALPVGSG